MKVPFVKMHGNGNDFVIVDNTKSNFNYNSKMIKKLSNRRLGIGCDQFIVLSKSSYYDVLMRIYNADGNEAEMCGNAARCVASVLMPKKRVNKIIIETISNLVYANLEKNNNVSISIKVPDQDIRKIVKENYYSSNNIVNLKNINSIFKKGHVINMGNPHVVFYTKKLDSVKLEKFGELLEKNKIFRNGVNIEIVEVKSDNLLRLKFWERGVGETLSCGSGILAAFYSSLIQKKCADNVKISLPVGSVNVKIKNNKLVLSGKTEVTYLGEFNYV